MYGFLKRLMDIAGSIIGLMILSPIFLLIALLIKITSSGPIFFTPVRVGQNGRPFRMYKFRSMRMYQINGRLAHAHEVLKSDPKLLEEYKKNSYKLINDPRITFLGKFLRKSSLDELPQILNILKGDMSLVGPRAYLPDELVEQQKVYPETKPLVKSILKVRPGLTGFWQVSGRSNINFDKRIQMDYVYANRKSIIYDLFIILKTFPALFSGKGAV
ncbi:MAG TPA: sugar transferase [Patescibacteria group bacterium]